MLNKLYTDERLYKKAKQEMSYILTLSDDIEYVKHHTSDLLNRKLLHSLEYACTCAEIQFERSWNVDFEVFFTAEKIKGSDQWIPEDCKFLCEEAGLLDLYEQSQVDSSSYGFCFLDVLDKAAEILGVQIF